MYNVQLTMADLYSDEVNHDTIISQFRTAVGNRLSSLICDRDCLRFLRARNGSIKKAVVLANSWDDWRHSLLKPFPPSNMQFTPNNILLCPDQPYDHPFIHLTPVAHCGFDIGGSPIYWERTGLIQANFGEVKKHFTADQLVLYHIQSQEVGMMRLKYASARFGKEVHNLTAVFDMKHLTMSLDMECIYYIKAILEIDQSYYPETLKNLFIINCPWYFTAIYSIFKPFIDAKTATKFQLMGSNYMSTLVKYIDRSQIPSELGGDHSDFPWLQFSPDSGATERELMEFLLQKYSPSRITRLLKPEEIVIMAESMEIRGRQLLLPVDLAFDASQFPLLTAQQRTILNEKKPRNVLEAFLAVVTIPDIVEYSPSFFPKLSPAELAQLQSVRPRSLLEACSLLGMSSVSDKLDAKHLMTLWMDQFGEKETSPAGEEVIVRYKDDVDRIVQAVMDIYFFALELKNSKKSSKKLDPLAETAAASNVGDESMNSNPVPTQSHHFIEPAEIDADMGEMQNAIATGTPKSAPDRNASFSSASSSPVSGKSSWAKAAGRKSGSSDYQFGDLTRHVVRSITGKSRGPSVTRQTLSNYSFNLQDVLKRFKTKIIGTEQQVEALMYVITVYCGAKQWKVFHRYSDFQLLRSQLENMDSYSSLPPIPPKLILGSGSKEVVQTRQIKLDVFLTGALTLLTLNHCNSLNEEMCRFVLEFIDPKDIAISDFQKLARESPMPRPDRETAVDKKTSIAAIDNKTSVGSPLVEPVSLLLAGPASIAGDSERVGTGADESKIQSPALREETSGWWARLVRFIVFATWDPRTASVRAFTVLVWVIWSTYSYPEVMPKALLGLLTLAISSVPLFVYLYKTST